MTHNVDKTLICSSHKIGRSCFSAGDVDDEPRSAASSVLLTRPPRKSMVVALSIYLDVDFTKSNMQHSSTGWSCHKSVKWKETTNDNTGKLDDDNIVLLSVPKFFDSVLMKFGAIMTEVEDRNSVSFETIQFEGVKLQSNHFFSPLILLRKRSSWRSSTMASSVVAFGSESFNTKQNQFN